MSRDQWAADFIRQLNPKKNIQPRGQLTHLFMNGLYWGLYNIHERPDASFIAKNSGFRQELRFSKVIGVGDKTEYDAIRHGNVAVDGTLTAYNAMFSVVNAGSGDSLYINLRDNYIEMV